MVPPITSDEAPGDRTRDAGAPFDGEVTSAAPPPPQPERDADMRTRIEKTRMIL
jgi:hypothetical protein